MTTIHEQAAERIRKAQAEGRLRPRQWRTVNDGRELLCLLSAASTEVATCGRADVCPAELVPMWLAMRTPGLYDLVSDSYRPDLVRGYADCLQHSAALDTAAWRRIELRVRDAAAERAAVAWMGLEDHPSDRAGVALLDAWRAEIDKTKEGVGG